VFALNNRSQSLALTLGGPAEIEMTAPYASGSLAEPVEYSVCPRTVSFTSPDDKTVACLDFQPNPSATAPVSFDVCDPSATAAYWFYNASAYPTPPSPIWAGTSTETLLEIASIQTAFDFDAPLMVLLYSSKSGVQPPQSFVDYRNIFRLTSPSRSVVPVALNSDGRMSLTKTEVDNFPADPDELDCGYDNWDVSLLPVGTNTNTNLNAATQTTLLLSYASLVVYEQCYRAVWGFPELVGLSGGALGIVIIATWLLIWIIRFIIHKKCPKYELIEETPLTATPAPERPSSAV